MLFVNQLSEIKKECLKYKATLVAVTKTRSLDELQELVNAGHNVFGENRVQKLLEKKDHLPKSIEWHLIGHLQTNKVKYIADFISMIHSVDSIKLLKEINKQAKKQNRVISVLLQFHVAQEESKFGIAPENLEAFLEELKSVEYTNIQISGIMGMASFTKDTSQIREEFKKLKSIYKQLKNKAFKNDKGFDTLSMGMSSDYSIALEEGSTMIRVGSKLFTKN